MEVEVEEGRQCLGEEEGVWKGMGSARGEGDEKDGAWGERERGEEGNAGLGEGPMGGGWAGWGWGM